MDIPVNQYKVSLKWFYDHGEEFLLTVTQEEVVKRQKKRESHYLCFQIVFFPPCVILFMVNLN